MSTPNVPEGHPIDEKRARELIASELGDVHRGILRDCMLPICWHERSLSGGPAPILNSGTVTVVRTPNAVLGMTAAHVVRGLMAAQESAPMTVQLMNAQIAQIEPISISDRLDLATFELPEVVIQNCGKSIVPISLLNGSQHEPQQGRGIMLGGYPAMSRELMSRDSVGWGMFTALGVARAVTDEQITWAAEREFAEPHPRIPELPANADLGGISGGPVIAWFERQNGFLSYCSLVGIISQASAELENVVAKRVHFIRTDGTIREP